MPDQNSLLLFRYQIAFAGVRQPGIAQQAEHSLRRALERPGNVTHRLDCDSTRPIHDGSCPSHYSYCPCLPAATRLLGSHLLLKPMLARLHDQRARTLFG